MTYEEYTQAMVTRRYTSWEQIHCDKIVEALALGFEMPKELAYSRAIEATQNWRKEK